MKLFLGVDTRDARPALAPTNMAAIIMEIFNSAMPQKKMVLPRPAPPRKLFRGKDRGKCSYITIRFWESKTFEQYFQL